MPFGIPSEDFHGGLGLPQADEKFYIVDAKSGENRGSVIQDDYTVSDEEYETAAQEAHDKLVRSLIEADGEIRELEDDKKRLIFALKEAVVWLDYFITTERDDIYRDDASEVRRRAEYLLMDLEDNDETMDR